MTLETDINALATAMGTDTKALELKTGLLANLSTTTKTNLVAAINEVRSLAAAAGSGPAGSTINDSAGVGAVTETWSADKIIDAIATARAALRGELVAGAAAALDTFEELAAAMGNDPNFAATIATGLGKRVRFDAAQVLTGPEKAQVLENIGGADAAGVALSKTKLDTLVADLGEFQQDYVAAYNAAKA